MRRVEVVVLCDNCKSNCTEEEAVNLVYTEEGVEHEVDLCDQCFDPSLGRVLVKTSSTHEENLWQCKHCDRTFARKGGLNNHITRKHKEN